MTLPIFLPSLRRMLGDRRGVTALVFAVSAVPVFGAVALATDAGMWYSARKGAGNAADVSALAAANVLSRHGAAMASGTALDVSRRNGFAAGGVNTVEVNIPPLTGPNRATPGAVEVIVRQRQQLAASGLFLDAAPTVSGRSVAALVNAGSACFLALSGSLTMAGNSSMNSPDCGLGSNRTSGAGITLGDNVRVDAVTARTVSTCEGCTQDGVNLTAPAAELQPASTNPFAHLDSKALPTFSGGSCLNAGSNPGTLLPYESNGRRAYCNGDIRVNAGETLTLTPGTYYLNEASLRVNGGGTVTCPTCTGDAGVTIVLTGRSNRVGEIDINGGATISLQAPADPADTDYRGILFYRDARATTTGTSVKINGNANGSSLSGGMYFPSSSIEFSGGSGSGGCVAVVAESIELKGNSAVAVQDCRSRNTEVPQARIARILE